MMKFTTLILFIVLLLTGFSCGKRKGDPIPEPDTVPPVLTLNGADTFFLVKGRMPKDPFGTATDNVDGDVTNRITSDWDALLNNQTSGYHTINYSVTDLSLLKTTAKRVVWIEYIHPFPIGTYTYSQIERLIGTTEFHSVSTTCTITPTLISDRFQVECYENESRRVIFTLEPKDSSLNAVFLRNFYSNKLFGKFSNSNTQFDFSGEHFSIQGGVGYHTSMEGHMIKIP